MKFKNLKTEEKDGIALLTIDRPKKLNALNRKTIEELHEAFSSLDADPDIRAIVVRGSGPKAFVAGADIAEFASYGPEEGRDLAAKGQETLFDLVEQLGTPVIAAVNGFALGGGLELALACHIRVASHNARMGLPEVSLGLIPGYGGTQRLPELVGRGRALEMILSGGMIDAERALEYGLVNHVTALEELESYCLQLAGKIAKNSPVAIRYAIKAVNAGSRSSVSGFRTEIDAFGSCFGTADFKEGTTAFLEKRKPDFPGE
ncbi:MULTISPECIES: enoyl-CoA hydratase/isomerase family protein [Robiginitalea]|uniref:3-hydroxybutyryl-CoA dehydratase n=1 Tax=Robiginitalea biformata (strain ATCC BAA-864 / DSM 15991 / KCTC 12146 / HTCC2501) TaxID=313596 RepID=A4CHJ4_ROBBH|nr:MULTISPECIES: enoyl-CoA hydratase-related protein [Robiginitalea]EAR16402.1 3-hydroxybutyryl-CoA dehydratase [Robiginitalea biformata HTCC2501]MDC6353334.1 enoyl-CoA hydratase-related protein [Robiginitalea sp. PM2]MDC6373501.1 enoyl-CoA hydratase-related protein [Robiginitalea sp. SP8]